MNILQSIYSSRTDNASIHPLFGMHEDNLLLFHDFIITGPLIDGMVVSLEQLPSLVRGTITSVHRDFQNASLSPGNQHRFSHSPAQVVIATSYGRFFRLHNNASIGRLLAGESSIIFTVKMLSIPTPCPYYPTCSSKA
jgi:hypothetical protein